MTERQEILKQIPDFPEYCITKTGKVWSNKSRNQKDAIKHGTHNFCKAGQQHYKARLNNLQTRVIRRLLEFNTLTQIEIGNIFSVGQSTISDIKRGRTWITV